MTLVNLRFPGMKFLVIYSTDNPDAVAGWGEDIFADEMTGSSMARPTWNELMTRARPDGTVVTQKHWSKAMQRKEIIVRGERFILEPLSPSVVRVEHRDHVGYFGIYKDWDVKYPFAFQTWEPQSYDDGVGNSMTRAATPESALDQLIHYMTEMQRQTDSQRINPEARKGMAQWTLHEFLEALPDSLNQ